MKRLFVALLFAGVAAIWPQIAAAAPGLQVAPLQYEQRITPGKVSSGFIDVSNPTDSEVTIRSSVKGFRQTGDNGDLEFFDDPDIAGAITVDIEEFTLGPREAVRVAFNVDAGKLPQGGNYGAVFFRTEPTDKSNTASYVVQSANLGTLLMLTNGDGRAHKGEVTKWDMPFWQFGRGIGGDLKYRNTDQSPGAVAFRPELATRVLPWGRSAKHTTGLVMPGSTRGFEIGRPGAYLGLLPVTLSDADTKRTYTRWVFACTGWYSWLLLVVAVVLIVLGAPRLRGAFPAQ